jgi:hypothetical protein
MLPTEHPPGRPRPNSAAAPCGFAGCWGAGALWGSLVGPEGTLIVGFLGGIAGAIAGKDAVDLALGK